MSLAIGIDIGGTKVAGGVVDEDGQVLVRARRDTPHRSKRPRVVEDTIVDVVEELRAQRPDVTAVGIGAAATRSAATTRRSTSHGGPGSRRAASGLNRDELMAN